MSGSAVIWYLLKTNSPVLAVVPVSQIMIGEAPIAKPKPLLLITQISSNPHNLIRINETPKSHLDRVQVSAVLNTQEASPQGNGLSGVTSLLRLVLAACPSQRGTVNSVSVDSIIPAGQGPYLSSPEVFMVSGSIDFFVRWSA